MTGDHHSRLAGRATLLARAADEIFGTHNTVRAAFLNGIRQAGGDEADTGVYRMDVHDDAGYSQILLEAFTVPPDAAVLLPAGSLAEYADDQILSELARRLGGRA